MTEVLIETLGWIGSVLIVGAYALNIRGKLASGEPAYVWMNLIGGAFFVVNTLFHGAYPSAVVNIIWVFIAAHALLRNRMVTKR